MGKRTTSRRLAMQAMYQAEISKIPIEEAMENCIDGQNFNDESVVYAKKLSGFDRNEADSIISRNAKDWSIDRMSVVDRNILRVAVYELLNEKETPVAVVIDEAVELAKTYGSSDSGKFINGILGGVAAELAQATAK